MVVMVTQTRVNGDVWEVTAEQIRHVLYRVNHFHCTQFVVRHVGYVITMETRKGKHHVFAHRQPGLWDHICLSQSVWLPGCLSVSQSVSQSVSLSETFIRETFPEKRRFLSASERLKR